MGASESGLFNFAAFTDPGLSLVGGRAYTYVQGTTTLKIAYTDAAGLVSHTYTADGFGGQYIALNSRGEMPAPLYLAPGSYDIALKRADGTTVWTRRADPTSDLLAPLTAVTGAGGVGFQQSGAGAIPRTVEKELRQTRSVQDFGAVPDGNFVNGLGTDNSAFFQQAINSISTGGGGAIFVPPGIYKLASQITLPDGVTLYGAGKWSSIVFAPTAFANTGGLIRIAGTSGYPTCLRGMGVLGQQGGAGGAGLVSVKNGVFISDVWVSAFVAGNNITLGSTENHLTDYVSELGLTGVSVTEGNCTVTNGTNYSCSQGLVVSNGASAEAGRVVVTSVRSPECAASGFVVSGGKHVTISACDAAHINNGKFSTAGYLLDTADDVLLNGCTGTILGTPSTVADGIRVSSSTRVQITGGARSGWRDGINSNASDVTVTGGSDSKNGRNGRFFSGGSRVSSIGGDCSNNGLSSTGSGIDSRNSSAFGAHLISGATATQVGGGPQAQGIYVNVTDNGANSGFTVVEDNITTFNSVANTSLNGLVKNIVTHSNLPEGATGSVATFTQTAATYTLGVAEESIIVNYSGTAVETLPQAISSNGREIDFKSLAGAVSSANADVIPFGGGAAGTVILSAAGKWCRMSCDGIAWQVMSGN